MAFSPNGRRCIGVQDGRVALTFLDSFATLSRSMSHDLFSWPPPGTTVVNLKEDHYDVRIDRKTKWGNPFVVGKDGTREEVIRQYADWVVEQKHLMDALHELKGKRLGCWCHPAPCHGQVLARLADATPSKE